MKIQSMSLRLGFVIIATTLAVMIVILSSFYLFNQKENHQVTLQGQQHLEHIVARQLERTTQVSGNLAAQELVEPIIQADNKRIDNVITRLARHGQLKYVYVYDKKQQIINDGSRLSSDLMTEKPTVGSQVIYSAKLDEVSHVGQIMHGHFSIVDRGISIGGIAFGLQYSAAQQDFALYHQTLALAESNMTAQFNRVLLGIAIVVILLIIPVAFFASRMLTRPLNQLANSSRDVIAHGKSIVFNHQRNDEVGQLANALNEMTTRLNDNHQKMTEIAYQDELTGLSNRRYFNLSLVRLMARCKQKDQRFALMLVDLDKFKQINDSAGHDVGDLLLVTVAKRLQHLTHVFAIKHSLSSDESIIARLGGDEFVIALPYQGCDDIAQEFAEDLIALIAEPIDNRSTKVVGSLSIGLTLFPEQALEHTQLLKNADLAMYEAKRHGGSQVQRFNLTMRDEYQLNHIIRHELRSALTSNQLYLHYQPFYCTSKNQYIGAEALIRWQHPDYGLILPEHFIELLEGSDLIHDLTMWVIEKVCQDSHHLAALKIPHLLSVNVSSHCVGDPVVAKNIARMLSKNKNDYQTIGLELTETGMLTDFAQCREVMNRWQEVGAQIWIDDFGTGYSSLSYLHELPIDVLKIDRSFISQLTLNQTSPVVMSIFALSSALGFEIVAEGVEEPAQAQASVSLGADILQGYLYGKPMLLDEFIEKMRNAETSQLS